MDISSQIQKLVAQNKMKLNQALTDKLTKIKIWPTFDTPGGLFKSTLGD